MGSILDILTDKRVVDKESMRLEDEISGRNVTEEMTKKKYKHEERKMRIKYEKSIVNMKQNSNILDAKTTDEETVSKALLDKKLDMERTKLETDEQLEVLKETARNQRDDLIKLRVRNSELDSKTEMLKIEDEQLVDGNAKLKKSNEDLEKENLDLKKKIHETIQRIEVNNLLKDIDIEDLQLVAKQNKQMNVNIENLITKWNFINSKQLAENEGDK